MENWLAVGSKELLRAGEMREVEVAGERVLMANVGGEYFAAQARCPHLRFRLARGKLEGKVVTCPGHGSTFDVTSGRNLTWVEDLPGVVKGIAKAVSKPKDLVTYAVKIDVGQVWVDLGGRASGVSR